MPNWKKVVVSGSDARLASLFTTSHITGSGDISGSAISTGSFGSVETVGNSRFDGQVLVKESASDTYLTIETVSGGDPQLIFNSDASGRSGHIYFKDQGVLAGKIIYSHVDDTFKFHNNNAGAASITLTEAVSTFSGNVSGSSTSTGSFGTVHTVGNINTSAGRVLEQGNSVIDHATAMAIVFGG